MTKPADLRRAVFPIAVSYNDFRDFKIEFCRPENKVEITEWIEITKILPIGSNQVIIFPE